MIEALISGTAFGLAAGLSPGPLMALVISQAVKYGRREGIKVALAPLCSDLPVVLLSVFVLSRLVNVSGALAWVSIAGGLFVGWLGYESLRMKAAARPSEEPARSLSKAIVMNLLNPHVYLFWITVGGPAILRSRAAAAAMFLAAFYTCLVGSKISLAVAASRSREFLSGRGHLAVMRVLGATLAALGVWLIAGGISTLIHS